MLGYSVVEELPVDFEAGRGNPPVVAPFLPLWIWGAVFADDNADVGGRAIGRICCDDAGEELEGLVESSSGKMENEFKVVLCQLELAQLYGSCPGGEFS